MNNQRKESRKKLVAFTPVYELLHKTLIGYIGDLTPQGVMVIGEKPVDINKHLTLGLEFPDDESDAHTLRVAISGRVAWCRQEERLTYFNSGLEFQEMTAGNKKVIEAILERFKFSRDMPA
jgi:hypothetical protein